MSPVTDPILFGETSFYICPEGHYLNNFQIGGKRTSSLQMTCVNTMDGNGEYQFPNGVTEWPRCVKGEKECHIQCYEIIKGRFLRLFKLLLVSECPDLEATNSVKVFKKQVFSHDSKLR